MTTATQKVWVLRNTVKKAIGHVIFRLDEKDQPEAHIVSSGVDGTLGFIPQHPWKSSSNKEWTDYVEDGYVRDRMMEQEYGSVMNFDDLVFNRVLGIEGQPSPWKKHEQATLMFNNGYGISVVTGFPGSMDGEYEMAVLKAEVDKDGNKKLDDWYICYDSGLCDDVVRVSSSIDESCKDIDEFMKQIQELKDDV